MSIQLNQQKTAQSVLVPGAKRGRWRHESGTESGDREFAIARPKVIARDQNRCVCCHIELTGLHVHHRDDDHSNNRLSNLETRDDLCHAVSHIGLLGKSGTMVRMGLPQSDISNLYRTMAVAIMRGGEIGKKARKLQELLKNNRFDVEGFFGTSNPADFGNAMLSLSDDEYARRSTALEGVKVVFNTDTLSSLATRAAKNTPESVLWERIYKDFTETKTETESEDV